MENMTLEQLIATFGDVVGKQMHAQMAAGNGGGNKAPFTFVKKVATHGSELGSFGDFCINVETEKNDAGERVITSPGTNLGTAFAFLIVNVSYRYRRWDAIKERTVQSNIFQTLDGIKTAVNVYDGKPLPATKEAKKEAEWKLVRINAGLIRKNSKAAWEPVIWETDGKMYFTLGEVVGSQPNGGLLSGVLKANTVLESKGSTQYPVIDKATSSFGPLPKDLFTKEATVTLLGDITTKMTDYCKGAQFSGNAPQSAPAPSSDGPKPDVDEDEIPW